MTQAQFFDSALTALGGGAIATFFFWVKGGFKQAKADNIKTIVEAVENAGAMLAKSNIDLQNDIKSIKQDTEREIAEIKKQFKLKEQQLQMQIDNLKLENKNLKLENENLRLENERLNGLLHHNIRKMS